MRLSAQIGINPNRYACAIEALMDRIAKGKGMPSINPAVDLGNSLSLKYRIPIGAHDMYTFVRPDGTGRGAEDAGISVRPATADDHFRPFGAPEGEFDDPEAGEIVYVSGNEIRTRRWAWRQSEQGKMQESTSAVFYPIDGFSDFNDESKGCHEGVHRTGRQLLREIRKPLHSCNRHSGQGQSEIEF